MAPDFPKRWLLLHIAKAKPLQFVPISALLLVVGPLSTDPEGRKFPGLDSNPGGPSFRRKESGNAKWGCGTRVTLGSYPDGRKTNPGEGCQR